jgi:hypothetical protein
MGIEYVVDLSWYRTSSYKASFLEKIEEYANRLLEENEGKKIIISDIQLIPTETVKDFVNICVFNETLYVVWYKDGLLHREDGPADIRYEYISYKLKQVSERYYYEGRYCCKLPWGFEYEKNSLEKDLGYLILDAGKINNKIMWLKILHKESIEDKYYWLM